jgi:hypothetical protein
VATGDLDTAARLFADAVDQGLGNVEPLSDALVLGRLRGQPDFERALARLEARRGPFADRLTPWLEWPQPARPSRPAAAPAAVPSAAPAALTRSRP